MSGTVVERRPPNRIAEMGTPFASSQWDESAGFWVAGVVKREFGCAAGVPSSGDHGLPSQSVSCVGTGPSIPSHQTRPSSVTATLVKIVLLWTVAMAFGLVC